MAKKEKKKSEWFERDSKTNKKNKVKPVVESPEEPKISKFDYAKAEKQAYDHFYRTGGPKPTKESITKLALAPKRDELKDVYSKNSFRHQELPRLPISARQPVDKSLPDCVANCKTDKTIEPKHHNPLLVNNSRTEINPRNMKEVK